MSDYIVTFDQNGSPTIAHSFKYFQKIKNGLKTRYFYSKAEWDAYQRNLSGGSRNISGGHGNDKVQTGTNPSSFNRPAGHAKNKIGEAKPGSIYRRGEGLNSSTPVTGSTGYVTKTKKEKEYAEAADALVDYKKKQEETKVAKTAVKGNRAEIAQYVGLTALALSVGEISIARNAIFLASNAKRDLNESKKTLKSAKQGQRESAKKFFKETGDFASIVINDYKDMLVSNLNAHFPKKK